MSVDVQASPLCNDSEMSTAVRNERNAALKVGRPEPWRPSLTQSVKAQILKPVPDAEVKKAKVLPRRPGEKICNFYNKTGICKFGEGCKWDHPSPESPAEMLSFFEDGIAETSTGSKIVSLAFLHDDPQDARARPLKPRKPKVAPKVPHTDETLLTSWRCPSGKSKVSATVETTSASGSCTGESEGETLEGSSSDGAAESGRNSRKTSVTSAAAVETVVAAAKVLHDLGPTDDGRIYSPGTMLAMYGAMKQAAAAAAVPVDDSDSDSSDSDSDSDSSDSDSEVEDCPAIPQTEMPVPQSGDYVTCVNFQNCKQARMKLAWLWVYPDKKTHSRCKFCNAEFSKELRNCANEKMARMESPRT